MFEMGIDSAELAKRIELPVETIRKFLRAEIVLTPELAAKIEKTIWMSASWMLRIEKGYVEALERTRRNPEMLTSQRNVPWT